MEDIKKVLMTAIGIERYGHDFYIRFSEAISDKEGKALMKGLARDEKEHENSLINEYSRIIGKEVPKNIEIDYEHGSAVIEKIFGSEWGKMENEDSFAALEKGIETEQKSIDFYQAQGEKAKDKALVELFQYLVKVEIGHKSLLEENLFRLKQDGSWWGYVPILEG